MNRESKPRIGLIVSTLMRDEFNDFTATRPAALEKLQILRTVLGEMGMVCSLGLLETMEDAEKTRRYFASEPVDAIVYTALSYQKGIVASRPLLDTDVPLLIWNTQAIPAISGEAGFDLMWTNSGLAGIPDLCNTLIRSGRRFELVTGPMRDSETHFRIRDFLRLASLVNSLRKARIATIGPTYPGMSDFMIDTFDLHRAFGPLALPIEPGLIAVEMEKVGKVGKRDVDSLVAEIEKRYRCGKGVAQALPHSAALALAMEKVVVSDAGADAAAVLDQIWLKDPRIGIPPTLAYMRLYEKGVPCVNEADVATCVSLLVLQYLAGKSAIAEFFDMDFDTGSVILCHDTNGNPGMAGPDTEMRLAEAPLYAGVHGSGVTCEFRYPGGDVTLLSIGRTRAGWGLTASEGYSAKVPDRSIGAPFLKFAPGKGTLADFCEGWCRSGATHHMGFCYGKWAGRLRELARFLQVGFSEV